MDNRKLIIKIAAISFLFCQLHLFCVSGTTATSGSPRYQIKLRSRPNLHNTEQSSTHFRGIDLVSHRRGDEAKRLRRRTPAGGQHVKVSQAKSPRRKANERHHQTELQESFGRAEEAEKLRGDELIVYKPVFDERQEENLAIAIEAYVPPRNKSPARRHSKSAAEREIKELRESYVSQGRPWPPPKAPSPPNSPSIRNDLEYELDSDIEGISRLSIPVDSLYAADYQRRRMTRPKVTTSSRRMSGFNQDEIFAHKLQPIQEVQNNIKGGFQSRPSRINPYATPDMRPIEEVILSGRVIASFLDKPFPSGFEYIPESGSSQSLGYEIAGDKYDYDAPEDLSRFTTNAVSEPVVSLRSVSVRSKGAISAKGHHEDSSKIFSATVSNDPPAMIITKINTNADITPLETSLALDQLVFRALQKTLPDKAMSLEVVVLENIEEPELLRAIKNILAAKRDLAVLQHGQPEKKSRSDNYKDSITLLRPDYSYGLNGQLSTLPFFHILGTSAVIPFERMCVRYQKQMNRKRIDEIYIETYKDKTVRVALVYGKAPEGLGLPKDV